MSGDKGSEWVMVRALRLPTSQSETGSARLRIYDPLRGEMQYFYADPKDILGAATPPTPPEPGPETLLVDKRGDIWTWDSGGQEWHSTTAEDEQTSDWPELWRDRGPIRVFQPGKTL